MWGVYTNIKKSNINWMVVVTTAHHPHHRTKKGRGQHVLIVEQCNIYPAVFQINYNFCFDAIYSAIMN